MPVKPLYFDLSEEQGRDLAQRIKPVYEAHAKSEVATSLSDREIALLADAVRATFPKEAVEALEHMSHHGVRNAIIMRKLPVTLSGEAEDPASRAPGQQPHQTLTYYIVQGMYAVMNVRPIFDTIHERVGGPSRRPVNAQEMHSDSIPFSALTCTTNVEKAKTSFLDPYAMQEELRRHNPEGHIIMKKDPLVTKPLDEIRIGDGAGGLQRHPLAIEIAGAVPQETLAQHGFSEELGPSTVAVIDNTTILHAANNGNAEIYEKMPDEVTRRLMYMGAQGRKR